ncbi:MAG TPA: RNA methyltransferase [Ferruginibacter sp.]|nr:RNA methyltransferase [Ferruginibacter sp.]
MISKSHTKYIQSLQHKKFRDESGQFVAEGPKTVLELLEGKSFVCKEMFALEDWLSANEMLLTKSKGTELNVIKDFELEKISALTTPNKVLAVFEKRTVESNVQFNGKITLVLDSIQDPGNFGTIIRTADWFGISTIVCSPTSADMYNPKVVQSTMGSLGRVNILYEDLVSWIKQNDSIRTYAAVLEGKPVNKVKGITEGAIIIGNEGKGIGEDVMGLVNEKITIARKGAAESLNAAVATGIILSQL